MADLSAGEGKSARSGRWPARAALAMEMLRVLGKQVPTLPSLSKASDRETKLAELDARLQEACQRLAAISAAFLRDGKASPDEALRKEVQALTEQRAKLVPEMAAANDELAAALDGCVRSLQPEQERVLRAHAVLHDICREFDVDPLAPEKAAAEFDRVRELKQPALDAKSPRIADFVATSATFALVCTEEAAVAAEVAGSSALTLDDKTAAIWQSRLREKEKVGMRIACFVVPVGAHFEP